MIDRHYGHLTSDGIDHARRLLDGYNGRPWTPELSEIAGEGNEKPA
jgi:hypothetical protein